MCKFIFNLLCVCSVLRKNNFQKSEFYFDTNLLLGFICIIMIKLTLYVGINISFIFYLLFRSFVIPRTSKMNYKSSHHFCCSFFTHFPRRDVILRICLLLYYYVYTQGAPFVHMTRCKLCNPTTWRFRKLYFNSAFISVSSCENFSAFYCMEFEVQKNIRQSQSVYIESKSNICIHKVSLFLSFFSHTFYLLLPLFFFFFFTFCFLQE